MKFNFIEKTGSYIPEPENYDDVLELIKSDYFRMVGKKDSFIKCFYTLFMNLLSSLCSGIEYLLLKVKIHFGSLANYYTDAICLNMV